MEKIYVITIENSDNYEEKLFKYCYNDEKHAKTALKEFVEEYRETISTSVEYYDDYYEEWGENGDSWFATDDCGFNVMVKIECIELVDKK